MYKEGFMKLVAKTKEANDLDLHSCIIRPPVEKNKLNKLVSEFAVPAEIIGFYEQMNGCQISYTFKKNMEFKKDEFGYYDTEFPMMWPNENYWHLDGCINILPLDFIFRNSWKDYIWFETGNDELISYGGEYLQKSVFEKNIRPLDIFSKDSIAAFFSQDQHCDVLLGTDHNAAFTDFEPVRFDKYFEFLILTGGLIEKRKECFHYSKQ